MTDRFYRSAELQVRGVFTGCTSCTLVHLLLGAFNIFSHFSIKYIYIYTYTQGLEGFKLQVNISMLQQSNL